MKFYLINLARDEKRRVSMLRMLNAIGIDPVVIPAVDGRSIDLASNPTIHDDRRAHRMLKRPLFRSEVGCSLSHLLAYENIVANGHPSAVVMEDDILIGPRFLEAISLLSRVTIDTDILLLGHHPPHSLTSVTQTSLWGRHQLDGEMFVGFPVEPAFGAYCYAITQHAAARILAWNRPVWAPADHFTAGADGVIRNMVLVPPVAKVDPSVPSNIQPERQQLARPVQPSVIWRTLKQIGPLRKARQTWLATLRECTRLCRSILPGPRPPALAPMAVQTLAQDDTSRF